MPCLSGSKSKSRKILLCLLFILCLRASEFVPQLVHLASEPVPETLHRIFVIIPFASLTSALIARW